MHSTCMYHINSNNPECNVSTSTHMDNTVLSNRKKKNPAANPILHGKEKVNF